MSSVTKDLRRVSADTLLEFCKSWVAILAVFLWQALSILSRYLICIAGVLDTCQFFRVYLYIFFIFLSLNYNVELFEEQRTFWKVDRFILGCRLVFTIKLMFVPVVLLMRFTAVVRWNDDLVSFENVRFHIQDRVIGDEKAGLMKKTDLIDIYYTWEELCNHKLHKYLCNHCGTEQNSCFLLCHWHRRLLERCVVLNQMVEWCCQFRKVVLFRQVRLLIESQRSPNSGPWLFYLSRWLLRRVVKLGWWLLRRVVKLGTVWGSLK